MEPGEGEDTRQAPKKLSETEKNWFFTQVVNGIGPSCFDEIGAEVLKLTADIALIDDAITFCAVNDWESVWTTINTLTDKNEIDKIVEEVRPESKFHKNSWVVRDLVNCLEYWKSRGFIFNQDSMVKVLSILDARLTENAKFLGEWRR